MSLIVSRIVARDTGKGHKTYYLLIPKQLRLLLGVEGGEVFVLQLLPEGDGFIAKKMPSNLVLHQQVATGSAEG